MENTDKVQYYKKELIRAAHIWEQRNLRNKNNVERTSNWGVYWPETLTGQAIYESFSDEELCDVLIRTYSQLGRLPVKKDVHYILRTYIKMRFGPWPMAWKKAGIKPNKKAGG